MLFENPREVEMLCYSMRQSDYPRASDRNRINQLFNGVAPYTEQEVRANNIFVNVNYLEATRLAHDARSQFYGAFLKPGQYFKASTDAGVASKRPERGSTVTNGINKRLKRSLPYFECFRSKFASNVLHGIGPATWDTKYRWRPAMRGVEDIMVPARTYLTMENLPFFAVYRSYTAPELRRLTRGPNVDPAWNLDLVEKIIEWIDKQTIALMGSNWPEIWSPEKLSERVKGDGGFYTGDAVPTADAWDLYFWDDSDKETGWGRRMILDAWSTPEYGSNSYNPTRRQDMDFAQNQWLYNPGKRKFASDWSQICGWQFADLSAVAPFQYHSVRSLGWLLYAVCTIQNRLRCKFNEAIFENLMMLLRVSSTDEAEKALKINLVHLGVLDPSVQIVPADQRHIINTQLVQLGLSENARLINENSQSYRSNFSDQGDDRQRKTKFQEMSELTATTALVQAGLMQAYEYQKIEYREIVRRFFLEESDDPDVQSFQAEMMRKRIPKSLMQIEAWEIEPERVMGAGNKALELQIAQQLMQYRMLFDPDPQRQILRDVTLAITDDPARAMQLVPETRNKVTDSVHDAQLAFGTLMAGGPVGVKSGYNHQEYAATLLAAMQGVIQKIEQHGGMATEDQILGLQNIATQIEEHVKLLAQDPAEKQAVKQIMDGVGKAMNMVKAYAQRLQEAQQKAAQQNGGMTGEDKAKIQAIQVTAQVKAENQKQSHAQRTAQRQLQWQLEMKQRQAEHEQEMHEKHLEATHDMAINRVNGIKSLEE